MNIPLVDLHCHLDLFPDYERAIEQAEQAAVHTVAVTTTPRAWPRNHELMSGLRYVTPALGLHPQLIGETAEKELQLWDKYLSQTSFVGEIGLDAGRAYAASLPQQQRAFEHILRACAEAGNKVLSVHSVRTAGTVLDMIEKLLPADRGRIVLHWFTGTPAQASRALNLGCYFSVNTPMLRTANGRDLLTALPADRLLTETDGPFTEVGKKPAHPQDVSRCIEQLARLRQVPPAEMASAVQATYLRLLRQP
jgi:TatD DNase family protein